MSNLPQIKTEALLHELQSRYPAGIFAAIASTDDENHYFWWGHRVMSLGLISRLNYSLNTELEMDEDDPDDDDEESADNEPEIGDLEESFGNYL